MARYIHPSKKKRLTKAGRQSKWAPFWAVVKKFSSRRQIHPMRITAKKRSWRRTKIKA